MTKEQQKTCGNCHFCYHHPDGSLICNNPKLSNGPWVTRQNDSCTEYSPSKSLEECIKQATPKLSAAEANKPPQNLWHDAQGEDLPEIDREVIVLCENGKVYFGHRPYKKGYLGKNLVTGNIETYYPETYGKGGWNIPDVKWWLDIEIPKEKQQ